MIHQPILIVSGHIGGVPMTMMVELREILVYLMETERPEINSSVYWSDGVIWIHYFAEEKRFEYEKRQDGSIKVIELSARTNFLYWAK